MRHLKETITVMTSSCVELYIISLPRLSELLKCVALTPDLFASLFGTAVWASFNLPLLVPGLFLQTSFPLVLALLPFSLSLIINLPTCRTPTPLVRTLLRVAGTAARLLSGPSQSLERGEKRMAGPLEATPTRVCVGGLIIAERKLKLSDTRSFKSKTKSFPCCCDLKMEH